MVKVLFVCLGNICRSPVAEGIMRKMIKEKGLEDAFEIDSCGTGKFHVGEQPDKRTLANALKNGIKLDHEARQFDKKDFRYYDYIITMDHSIYNTIVRWDQTEQFKEKLHLLRDFDPVEEGADVPDPYFGDEQGFQSVYVIIERSVQHFVSHLIEKNDGMASQG